MKSSITVGLPASGKSTWAREYISQNPNTVRVNNDDIRDDYYETVGHRNWSSSVEDHVRSTREKVIRHSAAQGQDIIVDNTHMNPKTLKQTVTLCESLGYEVEIVDFRHVSVDECVRRDSLRDGHTQVGEKVIRNMHRKFCSRSDEGELPRWDENTNLPLAIIVDIDGTLAEMHDRGPYDEHLVYNDLVRKHVLFTVRALQLHEGCKVIFMSGRSAKCHSETARYLKEKCQLRDYLLLMRAVDDRRRDSAVKRELYEKHVMGRYSVLAVFDDRRSVIEECWDQLNLPVFRCGRINHDNF